VLWVGAENGLGRSTDEGANWRIIRDLVRVRTLDTNSFVGGGGVRDSTAVTYAAPNPFSPSAGDRSLIVFSLQDAAQVDIDIYDFASRKVRSLVSGTSFIGGIDHQIPWDGRDDSGQSVANGTYFYRIQLDSGRQAFGKVVVLD
jgi:flagellar hook assembly protein FlgD